LNLDLVATHPDGFAGLAFLTRLPRIFIGFTFSVSVVIAGRWAHDLYYHDASLASLKLPFAALVIVLVILQMLPLAAFTQKLLAFRREALYSYGCILSKHGRLVRDRWIRGEKIEDTNGILSAQELGPLTDINAMYEAVEKLRPIPFNRDAIVTLVAPIALPFLPLVLLKIPVKELVAGLLKTLL
jgi:hypothetical protein